MRRSGATLCRTSLTLLITRPYRQACRFYSNSPLSIPAQTTQFSIDTKLWVPSTSQYVERDLTANPIPSTRKWTIEELKFFNLHYYQITDPSLWSTYFCAEAPMRPEANDIATSKFDAEDIIQGAHIGLPVHLRLFGEKLYNTLVAQRTEATDDLVMYLLQICNPGRILLAEPRMGQFKIRVGEHEFVSRPDATVEARTKINFVGPTFVVVEDKPDPDPIGDPNAESELDEPGVKGSNKQHYKQKWNMESKVAKKEDTPGLAKFQLAGEMLAAAVRNYNVYRMPQTVFALRVIGTRVTHYRADFPVSYLESIKKGTPTGNITILRMGGSDSFEDRGVRLLHYGEDRKNLIQWICNIMTACEQITMSLKNNEVPRITAERIAQLEKYL